MKRQIRMGTFETNSSSVHSLTIVGKDEFDKFKAGELLWYRDGDKIVSKEELIEILKKWYEEEEIDDDAISENSYSYDNIGGGEYETFEQEYTTKSGDKVVAFGYYGYN